MEGEILKKSILGSFAVVLCLFLVGCASAGSIRKIDTLDGDSFNAFVLKMKIF
jgi:hypothetical protein